MTPIDRLITDAATSTDPTDPVVAELARIVREQAAEIAALKRRASRANGRC